MGVTIFLGNSLTIELFHRKFYIKKILFLVFDTFSHKRRLPTLKNCLFVYISQPFSLCLCLNLFWLFIYLSDCLLSIVWFLFFLIAYYFAPMDRLTLFTGRFRNNFSIIAMIL